MSGVWEFRANGVLILNPGNEPLDGRRRVLVHLPTNEVITSYASLEQKLSALGWERYYNNPDLIQFHKRSSVDLISLPREFARLRPFHLFDIVLKNSGVFEVRDM